MTRKVKTKAFMNDMNQILFSLQGNLKNESNQQHKVNKVKINIFDLILNVMFDLVFGSSFLEQVLLPARRGSECGQLDSERPAASPGC